MKTIIHESARGLKFRRGKFIKPLLPGKYLTLSSEIEVHPFGSPIKSPRASLNCLLENPAFRDAVTVAEVADHEIALHYIDGRFCGILPAGKHAVWRDEGVHTFTMLDTSVPEVDSAVPAHILAKLPASLITRVEIAEHERGRLYYNRGFVRLLTPGVYHFWDTATHVAVDRVDTRLIKMTIGGQELLTQDKVTLRINLVIDYKLTDYVKVATEIDDYEEQLRVAAQLALRDYIAKHKLDEILDSKEGISQAVFTSLSARAASLYLTVSAADVKDIILPGEIRDIMNTVLVAEKRAQANVITRREEVASTRSLLNTAKLMEENPTLYRLKELEYVERICTGVGSLHLNGSGDLLAQLTALLRPQA